MSFFQDVKVEMRGWIAECLADVEQEGGCSIIGLLHRDGSGRENTIFSMKSGSGKFGDVEAMVDIFYRFAQRHANGLIGQQQFELNAVWGKSDTASRVLPFGMPGRLQFGAIPGGGATEPPTEMGMRSQGMRMGEMAVQGAFGQMARNSEVQQRIVDGLMRRQTELEQENRELWIGCKNLLLELGRQRHDERMKELTAARLADFQKQAMRLAPALLNMVADREIFPLAVADESIFDFIASTTTPEDFKALTTILAQKEGGEKIVPVLIDRYNKYHERAKEEARKEQRLLAGLPDRSYEEAERDAMGDAMKALRPKGAIGGDEQQAPALPAPGDVIRSAVTRVLESVKEGDSIPAQPTRSTPPPSDDKVAADLMRDLFAGVPADQIGTMIAVLGANNPALGERLKVQFENFKGQVS